LHTIKSELRKRWHDTLPKTASGIELLNSENALDNEAHFKNCGLTRMAEQTHRLLVR
jgi:hypothetical protein